MTQGQMKIIRIAAQRLSSCIHLNKLRNNVNFGLQSWSNIPITKASVLIRGGDVNEIFASSLLRGENKSPSVIGCSLPRWLLTDCGPRGSPRALYLPWESSQKTNGIYCWPSCGKGVLLSVYKTGNWSTDSIQSPIRLLIMFVIGPNNKLNPKIYTEAQ